MVGFIFLMFKSSRLIFILMGLELMMFSVFWLYLSVLSEWGALLFLGLITISSITGMMMLAWVIVSYGEEMVMF